MIDRDGRIEAREPGIVDVLTPIDGDRIDPPAKPKPKAVEKLDERSPVVGVAWSAKERFASANASLLAGGTAYYAFLALFSLLAVAYGIVALIGADDLAGWLTDATESAFPGMVGDEGIDPDTLMRLGRRSSVVGLATMAWSGSAVMVAVSAAIHQIYGAAPDGRNPLARRAFLIGWLAVLGPLIVVSYTISTTVGGFGREVLDDIGIDGAVARTATLVGSTLVVFALDVGIVALFLGRLGGIRPARRPLLVGAVVAALLIEALKALMTGIVAWSVDKPQYGAFALPIAILVVVWFQSMALYGGACLTAATSDRLAARPNHT